jgi:hypothetical protein
MDSTSKVESRAIPCALHLAPSPYGGGLRDRRHMYPADTDFHHANSCGGDSGFDERQRPGDRELFGAGHIDDDDHQFIVQLPTRSFGWGVLAHGHNHVLGDPSAYRACRDESRIAGPIRKWGRRWPEP